jgi:ketosteroid isomerase-like protein
MEHDEAKQRRAIERTVVTYCDAVDRGDIETVVGRFTVDAVVDYGPRTSATGREAIARLFGGLRTTATATSHRLTNVVVDLGDDAARATSYVTAWHALVEPAGEQLVIHGRYLDRLEPVDGDWLIAERRLEVHGSTAPVPFHPLPRRTD